MTQTKPLEKIILGIDPGTSIMGYGVILTDSKEMKVLQYGVIHLSKYNNHALKLKKIFERVTSIIDEYHPDEIALEEPFYAKNIQSTLKLGRAQGVAMAAALVKDIPINEYTPKKVKQSVTGNGNASKEQVAAMMKTLLNIKDDFNLFDASDALAVAICHHYQNGATKTKAKSWNAFLSENPSRVKK